MSGQTTINKHVEIIVGTFVVGTLAFIVANGWNDFSRELLKELENEEGIYGGKGMVFYSGIYVLIATIFSLFVMYLLVKFEIVHHSGAPTG